MLSLQIIRQNPEEVKQKLAVKNFSNLSLVDKIIELDDKRKKLQTEFDTTQAEVNKLSKQIGMLIAKGNADEAEKAKQAVANFKNTLSAVGDNLDAVAKELNDTLVLLPNLPSATVPKGKTSADNEIVREDGTKKQLPANALAHWDLIKKFDLVDFELGGKITGSGFPLFKGKGAKLERSLIQFFLDENINAGYTEYLPPLIVNTDTAYGTGQLPDKEGQMYFVAADNFYLIPTAEVPLTNIYRDEILKPENLPIKMTGYTPCFRREAGSFGADVRGLNRVHQFDKVEIVQLTSPEKSYDTLNEMVLHVENILIKLELPYRILRLCGGDMSFASALTYDFEVYSLAQQKWLEVSSVSNFETFQTNRMKIRYKDEKGKSQLLHSLNGSSLALPRIVAALLENNQTDNEIILPKALHNYFGGGIIGK